MQAQAHAAKRLVWLDGSGVNKPMEARQTARNLTVIENDGAQNPAYFRDLLRSVGQKHDKQAFAELFEYFAPRIKSFLMKGGAAPDQADELAQETMITVWQRAGTFDPSKASASTWIFTIARKCRPVDLKIDVIGDHSDSAINHRRLH